MSEPKDDVVRAIGRCPCGIDGPGEYNLDTWVFTCDDCLDRLHPQAA